jgi:hypothetical protein
VILRGASFEHKNVPGYEQQHIDTSVTREYRALGLFRNSLLYNGNKIQNEK